MDIAIVYQSRTGNTAQIAEAIRQELTGRVVYMGPPEPTVHADLYFVGSWTDKGTCTEDVGTFLKTLHGKRIAYFGTAGFGGSKAYFQALFTRIRENISTDNQVLEPFFCQGKMPAAVQDRYVGMAQKQPEDPRWAESIRNFDLALSHPDQRDCRSAAEWAAKAAGL